MKILVLGAGKMVEAILIGLSKSQSLKEWGIYSPSGVTAEALAKKMGATFVADLSKVTSPEWIVVGCKPQQLLALKETLAGRFKDALYLSLLAALSEKFQCETLGVKRLVRVMPNLSVRFNEGVTLLSSTSSASDIPILEKLFNPLGLVKTISETQLEELTLLTGSGPALFYEFTRSLAGTFTSLPESEREALARQVLFGAGMSCKNESEGLQGMIDAVTSKGGVTIAVLEEWRRQGLHEVLKKGVAAGKGRTAELKKILV